MSIRYVWRHKHKYTKRFLLIARNWNDEIILATITKSSLNTEIVDFMSWAIFLSFLRIACSLIRSFRTNTFTRYIRRNNCRQQQAQKVNKLNFVIVIFCVCAESILLFSFIARAEAHKDNSSDDKTKAMQYSECSGLCLLVRCTRTLSSCRHLAKLWTKQAQNDTQTHSYSYKPNRRCVSNHVTRFNDTSTRLLCVFSAKISL